jgi:hypothetical protein
MKTTHFVELFYFNIFYFENKTRDFRYIKEIKKCVCRTYKVKEKQQNAIVLFVYLGHKHVSTKQKFLQCHCLLYTE